MQSRVSFNAQAGQEYIIAVDGYNAATGSAQVAIATVATTAPGNDDFAGAFAAQGFPTSVSSSNQNAIREVGEPNHVSQTGGASVWWRWTETDSEPVAIDTFGSNFDTMLAVYTGNALLNLSLVGENDDVGVLQSLVSVDAIAGTTYSITVDGFQGDAGSIVLNVKRPSRILLIDDDDDVPDSRSYYKAALDAIEVQYDVWDTANSDDAPDANYLARYDTVVWCTGDNFSNTTGPGPAGETALASYLGVASVTNDIGQTVVTGSSLLDAVGQQPLSYPFTNFADAVVPDSDARVVWEGNNGAAGMLKASSDYRESFWVFPFEALPDADTRELALVLVVADCLFGGFQPKITQPVAGSTLSASSVNFQWSGEGAPITEWRLYVGSTPGANDIFDSGDVDAHTTIATVTVPTNGRTLHMQLWYSSAISGE